MTTRIANKDARSYVERRIEFKGSNLWGESRGNLYIVFSYGVHFPVCLYDRSMGRWFYNTDSYSSSTQRHKSRCGYPGETKDTLELQRIISAGGYFEMIDKRVVHAGGPASATSPT